MSGKRKRPKAARGKRRANYKPILIISLILIAGITLGVLSFTVFFPVKTITVKGEVLYTAAQVSTASGVNSGDNMLSLDDEKICTNIISLLPYVDSAKLKRHLGGELEIIVTPETEFAQIESGGKYIVIDDSGKCLKQADSPVVNVTIVRGITVDTVQPGQTVILKDDEVQKLSEMFDIMQKLAENELTGITVVNIGDLQDISVTYQNKILLLYGSSGYVSEKTSYAANIIKLRESNSETGTLNLSRVTSGENKASFIPETLENSYLADNFN